MFSSSANLLFLQSITSMSQQPQPYQRTGAGNPNNQRLTQMKHNEKQCVLSSEASEA